MITIKNNSNHLEFNFNNEETKLLKELIKSSLNFLNDIDETFEEIPWEEFGVAKPSDETLLHVMEKLQILKIL